MGEKEKTAACKERQSDEVIIDKIIKIIATENLTIEEADKILHGTSKKINQQTVRLPL